MASFRPTLVEAPPPKRPSGRSAGRKSRYAPLLDFALDHEGHWLRAGVKADAKRAQSIAGNIRSAGVALARRTGLTGTFEAKARVDADGVPDVYLRYVRGDHR